MFFWNARFRNDDGFAKPARVQSAFPGVTSPAPAKLFGGLLGDDPAVRQRQDEPGGQQAECAACAVE
jgi:hypothetical protein